jgi:hypothetical protein
MGKRRGFTAEVAESAEKDRNSKGSMSAKGNGRKRRNAEKAGVGNGEEKRFHRGGRGER